MQNISKGTPARFAGHEYVVAKPVLAVSKRTIVKLRDLNTGKKIKAQFQHITFTEPGEVA